MAKVVKFFFEIEAWVIHSAPNWTPQQAENALDLIEKQITTAIEANGGTRPDWIGLAFNGRSTAMTLKDEKGRVYLSEAFPILAVVPSNAEREAIRVAITALLRGAVTAAKEVLEYQTRDFGTKSPVVYVASAGSDRTGS